MTKSLILRVGVAKVVGLAVGLVGFFVIGSLWPDENLWLRFGVLMWYTMFGAVIGVFGLVTYHPMFGMRTPFWFRGPVFGAMLNFVLVLLMYERLAGMLRHLDSPLRSPFWFVLEGAIVGLAIDWSATTIGGEGRDLLEK
jgi:hypothetical protein